MLSIQNEIIEPNGELIQGSVKRSPGIHSSRYDGSLDNELFSQFMRRSVKWFFLASIVGVGVAWWVGKNFSQDSFIYTGRLTLEQSTVGYPFFAVPAAIDMAVIVDAPETIRELHQKVEMKSSEADTAKAIEVEAAKGAYDIMIEYADSDPRKAEEIVNTLMQIVTDRSREVRDGVIAKHLETLEKRTETLEAERIEAQAKYDELCLTHNSHDLLAQSDANLIAKRDAETAIARQKVVVEIHKASISDLEKRIENAKNGKLREEELALVESDVVRQAELERRAMLTDQLAEHRRREAAKIKLKVKLDELVSLQSLYERELVTQTELQAVESEVAILKMEASGDQRSDEIQGSISKIFNNLESNDYVNEAAKNKALIRLDEKMRDEKDRAIIAEAELANSQKQLDRLIAEYKSLVELSPKIRDCKVKLDGITNQQDRLQEELQAMQRLRSTDGYVLNVSATASPALTPVSSNKAKLMVAGFGGSAMLLLIPALLLEFFRVSPNRHERLATKHGLPILSRHARRSTKREPGGSTARILASRIQRLHLSLGSSVALVATGKRACPTGILFGAATHLAKEGGRVLIVEIIGDAKIVPLPCEYTTELIQDQELQTSTTEAVDRLLIKDAALLCDAMSSNTWDELAASIRSYHYILIGGLSAKDPTTATLVASGADAVVVCSLERDGASPAATHLINDLIDFDARLLGAVIAS